MESDDIAPIRAHLIESIKKKGSFSSVDFLIVFQAIEGFMIRFLYEDKSSTKNKLATLLHDFSDIAKLKCNEIDVDAAVNSRHYYSHFSKITKNENTGRCRIVLFDKKVAKYLDMLYADLYRFFA